MAVTALYVTDLYLAVTALPGRDCLLWATFMGHLIGQKLLDGQNLAVTALYVPYSLDSVQAGVKVVRVGLSTCHAISDWGN